MQIYGALDQVTHLSKTGHPGLPTKEYGAQVFVPFALS